MATGITPTYRPTSAIRPKKPRSASGVSAATSIEALTVPPVAVSSATS